LNRVTALRIGSELTIGVVPCAQTPSNGIAHSCNWNQKLSGSAVMWAEYIPKRSGRDVSSALTSNHSCTVAGGVTMPASSKIALL
jgi:hypothetical protein